MKKNLWTKVFLVAVILVAAFAVSGIAVAGGPADKDSNNVSWWWGDPAGSSTIVRTDSGISGTVSTSLSNEGGSYKNFAVTLWLVVFNNPDECATTPCGEPDLFLDAVMADVLYGAGHVIGGSEEANFGVHLNEGDTSGSILSGYGLIDAREAEIHYVLRSHGPAIPDQVSEMIHTFDGGCIYNAPMGHPPPGVVGDLVFDEGDCQDIQFAINQP